MVGREVKRARKEGEKVRRGYIWRGRRYIGRE